LALDKEEEIRLEHKLELRRILIDRVGVGLLIVVAAFLSNSFLEKIKRDATEDRFILEKKLEAISLAQADHSNITTYLYDVIGKECTQPFIKVISESEFRKYQELDSTFRSTVNSKIYLLSQEYQSKINRVHNLVAAIASKISKEANPDCKLRVFLHQVTEHLELFTRKELGLEVENYPQGYSPIEKTPSEIEELGLIGYFDINFKAWADESKVLKP